ncbi:GTPase SAR1 family protein [Marmoricola sp. OAE513]|uniref:ABC transporter n=1 Tax=Marmoricola sp. OAE513 TaxID=2817894 RepID=UPI001D4B7E26
MTSLPLPGPATAQLVTTLVRLREALEGARLPLAIPDSEPARKARAEMLDQLEDYILPRLIQIDAPLLTVVGGSTGAGKSTLVNSLIGQRVTEPGVLRPTTRAAVLVYNPADAEWFSNPRILPDLRRTADASIDPGALQLVASTAIPPGLAVLDAPDIDSVEEQNRTLATQLLGAADLWLFVTSAARYADQIPWEYLRQAAERSAAVAIVLDRTPPDAVDEVSTHLARMLSARGLRDSPLFIVPEGDVDAAGLLPSSTVREIRAWLSSLAADTSARQGVIRQTLEGAIRTLPTRSFTVADASHDQVETQARLRREAEIAYEAALNEIDHASADGSLLRGEVLTHWQEFVGSGEILNGLESRASRLRDRVSNAVKGAPQQASLLIDAVESGLQALIVEHAETAAARTDAAWRSLDAGAALLDSIPEDLSRASRDLRLRAEQTVREWQQRVTELIGAEGGHQREGLSVAMMVVVLGHAGSTTDGVAALGAKILEAAFGETATRRLAAEIRGDLNQRMLLLVDSEQRRYGDRLDALGVSAHVEEELRSAARQIDDIRFAVQPR